MRSNVFTATLAAVVLAFAGVAQAEPATYSVRFMTPETAQKAANAALAACRKAGYQVAVAVVDRSGVTQVMLRDRFAGPHTPEVAADKAWTAVSWRANTTDLVAVTQPGQASSGLRVVPRFTPLGGGLLMQAAGTTMGGIGVSGAPSGEADDACAQAGIDAVQIDLEM
jgi:uncharacterized protein GlcG (DUF336 family)